MKKIILYLLCFGVGTTIYAQKVPKPCTTNPKYRQFDFWIGNWDVKNPAGKLLGNNKVILILDSCVVMENWEGLLGGAGKSFNYLDTLSNTWHQQWVSSQGVSRQFSGHYKDNVMYLQGKFTTPGGVHVLNRLTFFKKSDNEVRQLAEQSYDEGKTWRIMYDFSYTRKEK